MTSFLKRLSLCCIAGVALTGLFACDNAGNHVAEYDCEEFDTCDFVPPQKSCNSTCDGTVPLVCNSAGDLVKGTDCALSDQICENGSCKAKGSTTPSDPVEIVTLDKWIGAPCECTPDDPELTNGCVIGNIPLPVPIEGEGISGSIKGCENVDASDIPGAKVVCLRTIDRDSATMAPPVYFPQGYCAVASVGCEGSTFCGPAAFGDVKAMTSCPKGTVMLVAPFDYPIMNEPSKIEDRFCAKSCRDDSDCNPEGEVYCIEREGLKFCYNEANFEFLGNNITFTQF